MHRLNVVMIGPFPADETRIEGGVQASVFGLCRRLLEHRDVARLQVIAVTKRIGGEVTRARIAGIEVIQLPAPLRFMMSMIFNLPTVLAVLADVDDPVVHLHGSGLFEALVMAVCRMKRVPVLWTMHGITEKETLEAWRRRPGAAAFVRYRLYRAIERFQLRFASQIGRAHV